MTTSYTHLAVTPDQAVTSSCGQTRPAIRIAVDLLNARLCSAESIGQALEAAAGDKTPPWVLVYREQVEAIRQAAEGVEMLLGGIGVVDPDSCQESRHAGYDVRGVNVAQAGSSPRPGELSPLVSE